MKYYPELSPYRHGLSPAAWDSAGWPLVGELFQWLWHDEWVDSGIPEVAVGWVKPPMEHGGDLRAAETELVARLSAFPRIHVVRSFPQCELCGMFTTEGSSCEILIRAERCNYYLPSTIFHNMTRHGYVLPEAVRRAIYARGDFSSRKKPPRRAFWHLVDVQPVTASDLIDVRPFGESISAHCEAQGDGLRIEASFSGFTRRWHIQKEQIVNAEQVRKGVSSMLWSFCYGVRRFRTLVPESTVDLPGS